MTYNDVQAIIRAYAYDLLPQFADAWGRFPEGQSAQLLAENLRSRSALIRKYAEQNADRLNMAAIEIERRMPK